MDDRHQRGVAAYASQLGIPEDEVEAWFAERMGERMRRGVESLRRAHSWDALADRTIELVDELKPGRGWR